MQLRNFDLNLLVTMEAIWSARSVSVAARTLNLAQSTVSASLNRLRQSLNDDLFNWSGAEMIPTPLAEQLMPDVRRSLESAKMVLESSTTGGVERRLTISTADYVVALLGGGMIERAARDMPHLAFDFVGLKHTYVSQASRPDVDLFIMPVGIVRVVGMEQLKLYSDSYVCVAAPDNEKLYPGMPAEAFQRLRHIGFSVLPGTTYNHETALWNELGIEISYQLTMSNYLIFPRIVAHSDAVAILPKRLALTLLDIWHLKWIEPPLPTPALEVTAYWKPEQNADKPLAWVREALTDITATWSEQIQPPGPHRSVP